MTFGASSSVSVSLCLCVLPSASILKKKNPLPLKQMLSPQAISSLQPSQLAIRITAVYPPPASDVVQMPPPSPLASSRPRVQDLTSRVQELVSARLVGEMWGVRVAAGEQVELRVEVHNTSQAAQLVEFSLGAANLASTCGRRGSQGGVDPHPLSPSPARSGGSQAQHRAPSVDAGVLLLGQLGRIRCRVEPGGSHAHALSAVFTLPGIYYLHTGDVLSATAHQRGSDENWASAKKVYASVDRLCVACT